MYKGWKLTKLKELVAQIKDPIKVVPNETYKLLGVRWYGNGPFIRESVTSETSKASRLFPVHVGDFIYNRLFAWKGSFGLITAELEGCFVSGEFPLFRVDAGRLDPVFLNLIMCQPSKWSQIEIESTGSTSVSRNRWKEEMFLEQELLVPPLPEQKRIVDLVSSVDAYIDALQQQADSARVTRNAVLDELLEADGNDWTETILGEVSDFTRGPFGGSLKKGIFVKSGYAVFEQQHAIYGDFSSFRYFVTAEKFEEMSRFKVSAGDLIMSCSGTIGKVSIVPTAAPQGIINQALLKISPRSEIMGEFLLFWTQSEIFKLIIGENSFGAVQQNVASVKILKNIAMALPPLAEQKRIIEVVSSMDELIQSTEQAVDDAKALRSGLLSDLLSGNHEIPASYDSLLGAA